MLDLFKQELDTFGVFTPQLPQAVTTLMNTIPDPTLPERFKTVVAISEISTFASQFRRNMWHWDGFELPINSVSFIIAKSGAGKDSAVKSVRRSFAPAYDLINSKRKDLSKAHAIQLAASAGSEAPHEFDEYSEFYSDPAPIYLAPTTPQGFIQHINDLAAFPIGAGSMFAGEFGDELASNPNIGEIIKTIAETYDLGEKEIVYTKGKDHRSKEISSMPISALFVGSPNYLIYDEAVKRKFLIAFGSKLARRSFFCYAPTMLPSPECTSVREAFELEQQYVTNASKFKEAIAAETSKIAQYQLAQNQALLNVDESVFYLFTVYKRYNKELSETIDPKFPLSQLVRQHLQWKALKLAGAFAIMKCHDTVQQDDYIEAIRVCELLDHDMSLFEAELVKEPYETFADYMQSMSVSGKSEIGLHNLRKLKYIPSSGDPTKKMQELIHLASSYDKSGIYSIKDSSIHYEAIIKTDVLPISFKPVDNSGIFNAIASGQPKDVINYQKSLVAMTTSYGLEVSETTFPDLANLLQGDYAYSPFRFRDGNRGKDYLYGGTSWLVLDIDDSAITHSEAHFMLEDINHHIALSSDASNHFKFRVLLQLDSAVDVDSLVWRKFFTLISEDLGFKADPVPQSQIFFSYSGREVLSTLDASPLPIRDYLMQAMESTPPPISKSYSTPQKQAMLADELTTFAAAFLCDSGVGSRKLIWAARYAYFDLGASKQDTIDLITRINNYWESSMPLSRLQATVLNQISRWS